MMFKISEWGSGWSNWCLYCCHGNDMNIASSPFISSSQGLYIQGCGRWKNFHGRFGSQGRRAINEHSCNIKQKKPLFLKNFAALPPHKASQCFLPTCDNLGFQYFLGSSSSSPFLLISPSRNVPFTPSYSSFFSFCPVEQWSFLQTFLNPAFHSCIQNPQGCSWKRAPMLVRLYTPFGHSH